MLLLCLPPLTITWPEIASCGSCECCSCARHQYTVAHSGARSTHHGLAYAGGPGISCCCVHWECHIHTSNTCSNLQTFLQHLNKGLPVCPPGVGCCHVGQNRTCVVHRRLEGEHLHSQVGISHPGEQVYCQGKTTGIEWGGGG